MDKGKRLNSRGSPANYRGPLRALALDEQLEVQRRMREAHARHQNRADLARKLAVAYGVSARTIWRYTHTMPVPPGFEYLRLRISRWAIERGIELTFDDMTTLLMVIAQHRDAQKI